MARPSRCTYYFEIDEDSHDGINSWSKGIYISGGYTSGYFVGWQTRAVRASKRVWRQGPKGGVKIVKGRGQHDYAYVTNNEEMMKKFIWIKLKAEKLKGV